jgi:hypothetical protein
VKVVRTYTGLCLVQKDITNAFQTFAGTIELGPKCWNTFNDHINRINSLFTSKRKSDLHTTSEARYIQVSSLQFVFFNKYGTGKGSERINTKRNLPEFSHHLSGFRTSIRGKSLKEQRHADQRLLPVHGVS